jgi:diguanylate cyclase (GGDEF)-like protein
VNLDITRGLQRLRRVKPPRRVPTALLLQAEDNLYLGACVALLLALTTLVSDQYLGDRRAPDNGLAISAWVVGLGFVLAARFSVRERISGTTQVLTAPEIILLPALFGTRPVTIVLAALVGTLIGAGTGRRRTTGWGLFFVGALTAAEAAVVIALVRGLVGELFVAHTRAWLTALLVMLAVRLLRLVVAIGVIAFSGTSVERSAVAPTLVVGLASCLGFGSIALVATIVATQSRAAILLVVINVSLLVLTYRAFIVLRERHARLRLLHDFTAGLTRSVELEDVIQSTLERASSVLRVEGAELVLFDGEIGIRHAVGTAEHAASIPSTSDWLWQSVLGQGRTTLCTGIRKPELDYLSTVGVRDAMAAPLLHGPDLLGILSVRNRASDLNTFGPGERELFTTMAEQTSVAIHAAQLERKVRQEESDRIRTASQDALTGLANRAALNEAIDDYTRMLPEGAPTSGAILTLDLNRFKDVNSVLGHEVGDALVVAVANCVVEAAPRHAVVARLGGDELAILVKGIHDVAHARAFAMLIQGAIDSEHQIGDIVVRTDAALGVALIPDHGRDHGELMRRADVAMYQAKMHRDSAIAIFDPDLEEISNRRLELLADLRDTINNGKLLVYYQPKANLQTGAIVGAEALLRWIHPVHGFISPDEFIALAEHAGLVHQLTAFVLDEALRQCAVWRDQGLAIHVAVNLSARSLREDGFAASVGDALLRAGVDSSMLTLELTEGEFVNDGPVVTGSLRALHELGVDISIDDFGTGYSSLSYLARLTADEVKIDKSFVMGIANDEVSQAIVRAVVELSERVGMRTVAEGVEDAVTWSTLAELGVEIAQGYYLSRPVPGETLGMWLWERRRNGLVVGDAHEVGLVATRRSQLWVRA